MGRPLRIRRVNHMEQEIRVLQLLQRCLECLHQIVGQLGNESDGVAEQHVQGVGYGHPPGGGVQGIKQPIVGRNARAGEAH